MTSWRPTAETPAGFRRRPTYQAEIQTHGAHNRTLKVIDAAPAYYTYNEANQLETEKTAAGTVYYHYDGCGNTSAKQATGGTTYLQDNTDNLLTRIDFAGGGHSDHTYDGDFKRVSQRTADGYTGFVYQGPDMLALQLERNEAGTTQAHYTIGRGLELVRRSGTSHFYHYNHLDHPGAHRLQPDGERHLHPRRVGGAAVQHRRDREPPHLRGPRAVLPHVRRRPLPPRLPRLRPGAGEIHDGRSGARRAELAPVRGQQTHRVQRPHRAAERRQPLSGACGKAPGAPEFGRTRAQRPMPAPLVVRATELLLHIFLHNCFGFDSPRNDASDTAASSAGVAARHDRQVPVRESV